jgi:integrase
MESPHIVPLSRQAIAILYELKKTARERARFLFPVLGSKEGVISENTINKALRTIGYSGQVMTSHGFRSTRKKKQPKDTNRSSARETP